MDEHIDLQYYPFPRTVFISLLLMLTGFLLHCCGERIRTSKLLHAILGLWSVFFVLLMSIDGYIHFTAANQYSRGSLYPLPLIPLIAALLIDVAGTIWRQAQKSTTRKKRIYESRSSSFLFEHFRAHAASFSAASRVSIRI